MDILFYGKMMRFTGEENAGDGWVVDLGMMSLARGIFWTRYCARENFEGDGCNSILIRSICLTGWLTKRSHFYHRSK